MSYQRRIAQLTGRTTAPDAWSQGLAMQYCSTGAEALPPIDHESYNFPPSQHSIPAIIKNSRFLEHDEYENWNNTRPLIEPKPPKALRSKSSKRSHDEIDSDADEQETEICQQAQDDLNTTDAKKDTQYALTTQARPAKKARSNDTTPLHVWRRKRVAILAQAKEKQLREAEKRKAWMMKQL